MQRNRLRRRNLLPPKSPLPRKSAAAEQKAPGGESSRRDAEKTLSRKKPRRESGSEPKPTAKEAPAAETQQSPRKGARRKAASAGDAATGVVRAHARYVRTSARKARMVCGHLRGKSVQEARAILAFTPREVARDWSKLLESAVANAESNHELLEDDLIVREAYADEGPTIKRFRPRAMGRATPIRKRTSHLTITLTPGSTARTTKRQS